MAVGVDGKVQLATSNSTANSKNSIWTWIWWDTNKCITRIRQSQEILRVKLSEQQLRDHTQVRLV